MLQLLQPAWIWLSAAIAIPVAIHLWNIKKGKVLQVGSIALLDESVAKRSMNVKLTELLLLLLRCLLILLLALLLAKPQWIQPFDNNKKGWVLIDRNDLQKTYQQFKTSVDSLVKKGYELHEFGNGFAKLDLKDSIASLPAPLLAERGAGGATTKTKNYWQLIEALNKTAPAAMPVYIFSDNKLQHFSGDRPVVNVNLHWKTYTLNDSSETVIGAYKMDGDSVRVVTTLNKPEATAIAYYDYTVSNIPTKYKSIAVDAAVLRVTIYSKYTNNAAYIKAAVEAAARFTGRNIQITTTQTIKEIPQQQDWLFWLSEELLPNAMSAENIFMYTKGKEENKASWLVANDEGNDEKKIALYKTLTANADNNTEILWQDAYDKPLLTLEQNKKNVYRFYSRFDPSWNDMVWSRSFPQYIIQLLFAGKQTKINTDDKRVMDAIQMPPAFTKEKDLLHTNKITTTDLFYYAWIVLFILFCLERFLSLKFTNKKQYA